MPAALWFWAQGAAGINTVISPGAEQATLEEVLPQQLRKLYQAKLLQPRKHRGLLDKEEKRRTERDKASSFCFDRWGATDGLIDRRGETKTVRTEIASVLGIRVTRGDIADFKREFRKRAL